MNELVDQFKIDMSDVTKYSTGQSRLPTDPVKMCTDTYLGLTFFWWMDTWLDIFLGWTDTWLDKQSQRSVQPCSFLLKQP